MHRTDHMRLMRENVMLTKEINNLRKEIQHMRASHMRAEGGGASPTSGARPPKHPAPSRGGTSLYSRSSRLRTGRLTEQAARREAEIQRQQIEHLEAHLRKLEERAPASASLADSRVEPAQ